MQFRTLIARCSAIALLWAGTSLSASAQTDPCTQPPACLVNGNLNTAGATGGDVNSGGGTNVAGWFVSHGSPSIFGGYPGGPPTSIWMWSYNGRGEGIFSCYNFQANHQYQICLWVRNTNNDSTFNTGNLNLYATNGLTGFGPTGTGVPTPPSSQLIDNSFTFSSAWTQLVYNFTPSSNFSQLWIYPFRAGPSVNFMQYELQVDGISILELPTPGSTNIDVKCGDNIVLAPPAGGCAQYDWYDPSSNYIGSGVVTLTNADPSMSGPYMLVITSGDCSATIDYNVEVAPCEPCDKFDPKFEIIQGCNPVSFIDVSGGPGTSVGWYWDFGDGTSSTLQNPTHAYAAAGWYEVCLTVLRKSGKETCCKKICKKIRVCDPKEGAAAERPAGQGFSYEFMNTTMQSVRFHDLVQDDRIICGYEWDFGDGITSGLPNPAHVYAKPGLYNVCLKVKRCDYDVANRVSGSQNDNYCQLIRISGSATASEMEVVPNPASDQATVLLRNISNPTVVLQNMYGAQVAVAQPDSEGKYVFKIGHLAAGVYMVTVDSKDGRFTKKLVKK